MSQLQTQSGSASQGLLLEFAFNQFEANAAFELAARADPNASMPLWGQAYALGPGANRYVWNCSLLRAGPVAAQGVLPGP